MKFNKALFIRLAAKCPRKVEARTQLKMYRGGSLPTVKTFMKVIEERNIQRESILDFFL